MTVTDEPATGNVCRLCLDPVAGRTVCEPCDRQRWRISKAHGVGFTECCQLLALVCGCKVYCHGCPGPDKVAVVLVAPDGSERTSHHPPHELVRNSERLDQFAAARGLDLHGLVLHMSNKRSWALGRLSGVSKAKHALVKVNVTCDRCGKRSERTVTAKGAHNVRRCADCRRKVIREVARRCSVKYRARKPKGACSNCGDVRRLSAGMCDSCYQRKRENGLHACGRVLVRTRAGELKCPACEPLRSLMSQQAVMVTITDGNAERVVPVGWRTKIGGYRANAWIAPVVLVERVGGARPWLLGRPVISGVATPGAGSNSRALLEAAHAAGAVTMDQFCAFARSEGMTRGEVASNVMALRSARLLDDTGITQRAHALVAWARAAGVKLS